MAAAFRSLVVVAFAFALAGASLAARAAGPSASPAPSPHPSVSATPSVSPAPSPSPAGTLSPVATSSPMATPSPAVTPPPVRSPSPLPTVSPSPRATPGDPETPEPIVSAAPESTPTGAEPRPSSSPGSSLSSLLFGSLSGIAGFSAVGPAQNYSTFIRNTDRQLGVIDIIRKDEEVYFDLDADRLDKTYLIAPSIASGIGSDVFAGRTYEPFLVRFKRVGRRVLWLSPNPHFRATPGTPAEEALRISVADSVIAATPIVAEDKTKHRLVIAPHLFLTDFNGIGADLGRGTAPSAPGLFLFVFRPSFSVDTSRSYYEHTKTYPKNDEITVNLTFAGPASAAIAGVPDARGIPIKVHYSIVEAPATDGSYVPRYADDRVGYFITAQERFENDNLRTPFLRYINRWNLEGGPIVFTLSREIPAEYRPAVRRGILGWNAAFAKAGHPHAIEVHDPPDDPVWDPDDIRYNTVRWLTSDSNDFAAYSPSIVNPQTGEIIAAHIVIEGEALRAIKRGYVEGVLQTRDYARLPADGYTCTYAHDATVQAVVGVLALNVAHRPSQRKIDAYAKAWLESVVLHEAGHALGLRHNFQASTLYEPQRLHDPGFTASHGISASVMDYNPINLAPPNRRQGSFFQLRLGPYDYWAIDYGYRSFGARSPAAEASRLSQITALSSRPEYRYSTDEDLVELAGADPRVAPFDLSSDPLVFDREQLAVSEHLAGRLDAAYPRDDRTYYEERQAFISVLLRQDRAVALIADYIGGVYTSRAHRGQPGGEPPFRPVPRAVQRRAFDLLADHVFSARAFRYPPKLLNDLAPNHYLHWNSRVPLRKDFPIAEVIAQIQDEAMARLFSPVTLARIADQSLKSGPRETISLEDLFGWSTAAIWDDLGTHGRPSSLVHRDLQRRYTDLLSVIALLPSQTLARLSLTHDIQSLARYQLRRVDDGVRARLRASGLDAATRAHLEDVHARVVHVLSASAIQPL